MDGESEKGSRQRLQIAPHCAGQAVMRHKTYATIKRYINMGRQLKRAVDKLHVPAVLKTSAG